jgi:hypothetical protein
VKEFCGHKWKHPDERKAARRFVFAESNAAVLKMRRVIGSVSSKAQKARATVTATMRRRKAKIAFRQDDLALGTPNTPSDS